MSGAPDDMLLMGESDSLDVVLASIVQEDGIVREDGAMLDESSALGAAERPVAISVCGASFLADAAGALFHEAERTLLVADLHLEKASRYAVRGQFLPPYDTAETLYRLGALIARYAPRRLICLGDSFHDIRAGERMAASDVETIALLARRAEIVWIAGNHDPEVPAFLPGERAERVALAGIVLRHEPSIEEDAAEICGHLHPVARVATKRGSVRRRCFAGTATRLVMPAFGALTGGLNIKDAAFTQVFGEQSPRAYVIGSSRVYAVGSRHLFSD